MPNIQLNPKTIKASLLGVAIVLVLLGVLYMVIKSHVDTDAYKQTIIDAIKAQTAEDATIDGDITFKLLPSPTFFIPTVSWGSHISNASEPPSVSVQQVEVKVGFASLFSQHVKISSIKLIHPALALRNADNGGVYWGWLNSNVAQSMAAFGGSGAAANVEVVDGVVSYHDTISDHNIVLENINASGAAGPQFKLAGGLQAFGRNFNFDASSAGADSSGDTPVEFSLVADSKNSITLKGALNNTSAAPKVNGEFSFAVENIEEWIPVLQLFGAPVPTLPALKDGDAKRPAYPLAIAAQWKQNGSVINLSDIKLDGLNSSATGEGELQWQDNLPVLDSKLHFASFDYTMWRGLLGDTILAQPVQAAPQPGDYMSPVPVIRSPLPKNIQVDLALDVDKLVVDGVDWHSVKISAALDSGAITLNQFDVELPGNSMLSLFGVISEGGMGGMRFEGHMETRGDSLRDMFTVFDDSAKALPEIGFGKFVVSANMFMSSDTLRLSEMDATVDNINGKGALARYTGQQPRIEADLKFKDVDLDFVRDEARAKYKAGASDKAAAPFLNLKESFAWLNKLNTRIDAKLVIDGFTFMERKGDRASFTVYANSKDFRVYDTQLKFPDHTTDASFAIDFRDEIPNVKLTLNSDQIDMHYFSMTPDDDAAKEAAAAKAPTDNHWSEDMINMGWMDGFNGVFDVSLGKFIDKNITMNNIKLQARLDRDVLTFQKLAFVYSQARCSVAGSVLGGKVPGISVSFTMANADLYELMQSLTGVANISGYTSLSGTVTTSGLNYKTWVEQMDAKLMLAGRGVKVQGVNISAVSNAVSIARTGSDVFNNANKALVSGSTEFVVDGSLSINHSQMRTSGITLKTGLITGNLLGAINLIPMTVQLSTTFKFPNLSSDPPTLLVQLSGPLSKPELSTDTSSLEAFVAKRIVVK